MSKLLTTKLFSGWCKVTIEIPPTSPILKKDNRMKSFIILLIAFLVSGPALAKYCTYNIYGKRLACSSEYRACMADAKRMNGDECKRESDTADLPPSLKETDPKAFCLWLFQKDRFKNMGCMAQTVCEYAMRQYPQTVCAKGSLTDMTAIKKLYSEHENKVKNTEQIRGGIELLE